MLPPAAVFGRAGLREQKERSSPTEEELFEVDLTQSRRERKPRHRMRAAIAKSPNDMLAQGADPPCISVRAAHSLR